MFDSRNRTLLAAVAVLLCLSCGALHAVADDKEFRAGAFAMDITPEHFPISVNGNMQDYQAEGSHDPLHARCLVLDDGRTRLAIVVCDSCMLPRETLDAAKERASKSTGIPADHLLISATHTHEAPTSAGVFQSEPDAEYRTFLIERIAQGIERASGNLAPARVGWGVGQNATQVFNRRWKMKPGTSRPNPFGGTSDLVTMNPGYQNPGLVEQAGPIDPDVSVLSVVSPDGRPIALLANYSLHYVGGVKPLSADYFGAFADRIAQLLQPDAPPANGAPPFVAIMSNGTSGDINNVNFAGAPRGTQQEYEQIKLVADSVARTALDVYRHIEHRPWVSLAMAETELELGVRLPGESDVVRAQEVLDRANKPVLTTPEEIYARETVLLANYPSSIRAKLQALRIGELGIVAIPCEVFAEIGLDIKRRSPLRPTFTIELANGYNGYLPTPQQHDWGGYETWRARSSYLEVEASNKITASVLELLENVAKDGGP